MFGNGFLFCLAAAASYPLGAFILAAQQLHGLRDKKLLSLQFDHPQRLQQLQRLLDHLRRGAGDGAQRLRRAGDACPFEDLALPLDGFQHQLEIKKQNLFPVGTALDDADTVIFKEVFLEPQPVISVFPLVQ